MMKRSAACLILLFAVMLCMVCSSYADSMFVDGKEIQIDPNQPVLYQYINAKDSNWAWQDSVEYPPYNNTDKKLTVYEVNYTSQRWLTEADVNLSLWRHNFTIIVPWEIKLHDVGMVYVTGCGQGSLDCVKQQITLVQDIAVKAGAIVAILTQIPNSSMTFTSDPLQKSRSEDAIVAFTWRHVLENPHRPDWCVYNAMAKATVGSFDVLEQWTTRMYNKGLIPTIAKKFYVAGASKRGATTWYTTAYMGAYQPNRLIGAAPLVFDVLNFTHSVPSMYEQFGGWTFAFTDYRDQDIISYFNRPETLMGLVKHVDLLTPWYAQGLSKIPKLVVSTTGDEFFLPLNDRYYFDKLTNVHRLMVPNAEHSMATGLEFVFNGVVGHLTALHNKLRVPTMKWQMDWAKQTIQLWASPKPSNVAVWRGQSLPTTPNRKDFRMVKAAIDGNCNPPAFVVEGKCIANIDWKHTNMTGTYQPQTDFWTYNWVENNVPTDGTWLGFYLMATWDGAETGAQVYTTQTMVLPDKMPFESCYGEGKVCPDNLV